MSTEKLNSTPKVSARELKDTLRAVVYNELEIMTNLNRAVESIEFSERIEKAVEQTLEKLNIKYVIVEYLFDEYPKIKALARAYAKDEQIIWWEEESSDILLILDSEKYDEIAEILIHYSAYVLQIGTKYYRKPREILDLMVDLKIEVGE
jgi:hypothetical protein